MKVVNKRWGNFRTFILNDECTIKILTVDPFKKLSLQRHYSRHESWHVLLGHGRVLLNSSEDCNPRFDVLHNVKKDDEIDIPKKHWHYVEAGVNGLEILEISTGFFDEEDIERIDLETRERIGDPEK